MPTVRKFDVIVIGAGMAGMSMAANLSARQSVAVLEMEDQPGYHSTGRSAAIFSSAYGPEPIRALTRASEKFLRGQVAGMTDCLLNPRTILFSATPEQSDAYESTAQALGNAVARLNDEEMRELMPLFRREPKVQGLLDKIAADIEVHNLHQHFVRQLKASSGELHLRTEVLGLSNSGPGTSGDWLVETANGTFRAPVVVNAAGAWADRMATLAGVQTIGLVPKRRTAALVDPPPGLATETLPMIVDIDEQFYLKPDAGKLLISPADETPSEPCDAQPEELDIALCVDRIQSAFEITVRRIEHKWAGLRSFVPSGCPVVGFAPDSNGFFWLAGQGGYGIQTAPALARLAAALCEGVSPPQDLADHGVDASEFQPG